MRELIQAFILGAIVIFCFALLIHDIFRDWK